MKKVLKKITVSLMLGLMLFSSTYAALSSVSATDNNAIQPRGNWYIYGDVDNNGKIDIADVVVTMTATAIFKDLTGDSRLPLSYAVARPEVYGLAVPQAADLDGDEYITEDDALMIQRFSVKLTDTGRCGQPFYIN